MVIGELATWADAARASDQALRAPQTFPAARDLLSVPLLSSFAMDCLIKLDVGNIWA